MADKSAEEGRCVLISLPPGGSKAKLNPLRLATQSTSPRVGGTKARPSGELSALPTERADPEVPEPAGETGGFCIAKDGGRVRLFALIKPGRFLRRLPQSYSNKVSYASSLPEGA